MICINCNTVWTVCSSVSRWPYPFIYCLLHSMYWCILSLSLVCACGIASTYIPHSTFDTIIARRLVTIVGDNWQVGHIINCPPMSTKFLHICSLCYFVLSRFPFFIAMLVRLVQVASNMNHDHRCQWSIFIRHLTLVGRLFIYRQPISAKAVAQTFHQHSNWCSS